MSNRFRSRAQPLWPLERAEFELDTREPWAEAFAILRSRRSPIRAPARGAAVVDVRNQ